MFENDLKSILCSILTFLTKSTRNNVHLKIMIFKRFSLIFQSGIVIYFENKGIQRITTSGRKNADCTRLYMYLCRS